MNIQEVSRKNYKIYKIEKLYKYSWYRRFTKGKWYSIITEFTWTGYKQNWIKAEDLEYYILKNTVDENYLVKSYIIVHIEVYRKKFQYMWNIPNNKGIETAMFFKNNCYLYYNFKDTFFKRISQLSTKPTSVFEYKKKKEYHIRNIYRRN